MSNLTLNLSTWEVIRLYRSFSAPRCVISDPLCPTLIIFKWWNGPTATDKIQRKWGQEERRKWNLTSDFLSWLTEAWQRRSGLSFSGGHRWVWRWVPSLDSLTSYEYHLSVLCCFSSERYNHIPALSNCSWQRCTACCFAERKNGDICHLTVLKLHSKSQLTLKWFKWRTQMFNDVQPSDVQCFIPLKLLNHSSLLAYSEESALTVTRRILSGEVPVFICTSPKTVSPVRSSWKWDHPYLSDNNGV